MKKTAAFLREAMQWDLLPNRSTVGQEHVVFLLAAPVVPEGGPAARVKLTASRGRQTHMPLAGRRA